MIYYIYHIPGKKIGVTSNLTERVTNQQGYSTSEYEVLECSLDIDYVSSKEIYYQQLYGYKVDRNLYKQVVKKPTKMKMKINVTEQTTTFPCPLEDLSKYLDKHNGEKWVSDYGIHKLDTKTIEWIRSNAKVSMFNYNRCYVYNKALSVFEQNTPSQNSTTSKTASTTYSPGIFSSDVHDMIDRFLKEDLKMSKTKTSDSIFDKIRSWAEERGIYAKGDSKTQYVKLMEESGELARAILKEDKPELVDAIGDMVVVLTNLAYLNGLDIEDCINSAYNVIKERKGGMSNGTFVKHTL